MIATIVFLAGMILAAPIAVILALAALALILESGNPVLLSSFPQQFFGGLESHALLALPMFILLGELMAAGGIGRRLMALAQSLIGGVRGALGYVTLIASVMMAAIVGSTVAQLTVMIRIAVPQMEEHGYPRDLAVAITAAGGLLAPIIPPSMLFILFGVVAQVPIGDLFIAGILPGALMTLSFGAVIAFLVRREGLAVSPRTPVGSAAWQALPALIVPVVIVGSILGGFASPTEAAVLASVVAALIGWLIYGELTPGTAREALLRTAKTSGVILFLVAAAQVLAWVLAYGNLPAMLASWIDTTVGGALPFLLVVVVLLILIGMVMDPIPAIILTAPVLLPLAQARGISAVEFGVVTCVTLTLGLLTPPVGSGLFAAAMLGNVRAEALSLRLLPFFGATLFTILIVTILAS